MASTRFTVIAVFALLLPSIALATQHIVGDNDGWKPNFNYTAWAANKVFRVGDTLLFKYTAGSHNVFKANQTEFQDCVKPTDSNALTTGHDEIPLKTTGKKWYICGFDGHCSKGQKLAITVVDAWAPAPAPTTPSAPTSSAFTIKASSVSQILAAAGVAAAVALL